jgi:PAS domain S-box-containing protein
MTDAEPPGIPRVAVPAGTDFGLLCETVPHVVWGASADGGIDYVNARAGEYTGIGRDALTCRPRDWLTLVHSDDVDGVRRLLRNACRAGGEIALDLRLRRADGNSRWFRFHGALARGQPGRWFGTATDR